MSVIAAKVYDNYIEICADSIIMNNEGTKRTNFAKLRNINNMIVGGCGDAEELCLFFNYVETYAVPEATEADILDYMNRFSSFKKNYTDDLELQNVYVIAVGGHLFEVDNKFVQEVNTITACGRGMPYALTALHLGHSAEEAISVTCDLCCYTSRPVVRYTISR